MEKILETVTFVSIFIFLSALFTPMGAIAIYAIIGVLIWHDKQKRKRKEQKEMEKFWDEYEEREKQETSKQILSELKLKR